MHTLLATAIIILAAPSVTDILSNPLLWPIIATLITAVLAKAWMWWQTEDQVLLAKVESSAFIHAHPDIGLVVALMNSKAMALGGDLVDLVKADVKGANDPKALGAKLAQDSWELTKKELTPPELAAAIAHAGSEEKLVNEFAQQNEKTIVLAASGRKIVTSAADPTPGADGPKPAA